MSMSPAGSSVSRTATTGRPKKSPVWEYFDYDELQGKSVCQVLKVRPTSSDSDTSEICGRKIEGKWPTNLRQHLKKAHPDVYSEVSKKDHAEEEKKTKKEAERQKASLKVSQQLTLAQSLQSGCAYDKSNHKYKAITQKLAIFVGTTSVPNSIVAFKDLLHTADPRYKVPSRTVVSKELESVYIEMRAKIGCFLQQANKVGLTADIWSKKGLTSSYLGVTDHFFSWKDLRSHCVTLAVRRLPPSHTAENIRSQLKLSCLSGIFPSRKYLQY